MTAVYSIDERALLNKFKSGDELAFDKIFRLHNAALIFFANRLLINHDQANAQDVVLDSFLKLYDRREGFPSMSSIKAFLYISVKNGCLNAIEKEKVRLKRFDKYTRNFDEAEENILSKIVHAEILQELHHAIEKLPAQYRQIMEKIVEGKSAKEISEEFDIPVSTVNTQKSRALSLLKKDLSRAGIALLLLYF
jgi:RNA polymerase sigma-70 factor (family 1)